jgi:hypothetical protein
MIFSLIKIRQAVIVQLYKAMGGGYWGGKQRHPETMAIPAAH